MAYAKVTASEQDGLQYRCAKWWQIALTMMSNGMSMTFYSLITLVSYAANVNYGIAMGLVGVLLTGSRVFDGIIDPAIALMIDRYTGKHGKIRFFTAIGWIIRAVSALLLFVWANGGGVVLFVVLYLIYIVGNSLCDIAGNMASPIITTDPRQRPIVGVWGTAYSYLIPMVLMVVSNAVLLPMFGGEYNTAMLSTTALVYVPISLVFMLLSFIGIKDVDKPENFENFTASDEKVGIKDMWHLLKDNRPFQMYCLHCVAASLGQQTMSQSIVSTLVFGILIGNIGLATIVSAVTSLPSIIFAILAGKFSGKFGSCRIAVFSMATGTILSILAVVYCYSIDMRTISQSMVPMVIFFGLLFLINAAKMCITTADNAMRSDVVDYELSRSGKYLPGVVTATYNFINQFISSLGTTIAAVGVSLIGYVNTVPQPTDAPTPEIKAMGLFLYFGIPLLGWVIGLVAMKFYALTPEKMIEVQKDINEKKAELAGGSPESATE